MLEDPEEEDFNHKLQGEPQKVADGAAAFAWRHIMSANAADIGRLLADARAGVKVNPESIFFENCYAYDSYNLAEEIIGNPRCEARSRPNFASRGG